MRRVGADGWGQEGQAFNYCTNTICLLFDSTEAIAEKGLWFGELLSCVVWLSRGWESCDLGLEAAAAFVRRLPLPVSCSLAWRHVGVWCRCWGFWRQRKEAFSVAPELGSLTFLVVMGYIDQRSMSMSSSLNPSYKLGNFMCLFMFHFNVLFEL